MSQRPFLIGLTGNIATGKGEVARLLAERGALAIDADKVAHEVMRPGGPAYDAVVQAFGPEILDPDGAIDRARLGAIVFRDGEALRRLEAAVHPAVIAEVDRLIEAAVQPVVVVEAIKLIEAGMHRTYDELWVVTAPRPLQIERLVASRGLSEAEAALRVDAQPPQEEKTAQASRVFANDGDLPALERQVGEAWAALARARGRRPARGGLAVRPVRRYDIRDAAGVAAVLNSIIAEGSYTALAGEFSPEAEMAFLQGLGPRSQLFVAEEAGHIIGFQVVEPFVDYTPTMDHVCQFATYVRAGFRGQGAGQRLAAATLDFARAHGYEKAVVFVLAGNLGGLAYYRGLGFQERGVLTRQTKIDGVYHDEVFLELHFAGN